MFEFEVRPGVSLGGAFPRRSQHCRSMKCYHLQHLPLCLSQWHWVLTKDGNRAGRAGSRYGREGKSGMVVTVLY